MNQFVSKLSALLVTCVVAMTAGSITIAQTTYSVTDLGDLPGGNNLSEGYAINDHGQVVGSSSAASAFRAFLWDSVSGMQDLGDLPGGDDVSYANDINNNGQVVGLGHTELGERAFLWDSVFGMQDLGELAGGGNGSWALAINDTGQVVGSSRGAAGDRAFLWDNVNGMQDLGDLPGGADRSYGTGINNSGQVVGMGFTVTGLRAFLWDSVNGMQDLGDLPGGDDSSGAFAINNNGQVVGRSGASAGEHAFLWDNVNGMQDLGDLPGGNDFSEAIAINNGGQVVGVSDSTTGGAFLWDNVNGMQNLNNLLDHTGVGWTLWSATGINSSGQIVGRGVNPDGFNRAFLLTPVGVVAPTQVTPTRGDFVSGDVTDLEESDNLDYSMRREAADIQSRTEFEVMGVSPVALPSSLEVTLEGSVFARSQVNQTIELYDYVAGLWEQVDTRPATRFSDSTVSVVATGDLSRFVEPGTNCIEARIRYQSPVARQRFSSNTDQFMWTIGQ